MGCYIYFYICVIDAQRHVKRHHIHLQIECKHTYIPRNPLRLGSDKPQRLGRLSPEQQPPRPLLFVDGHIVSGWVEGRGGVGVNFFYILYFI